MKSISEDLKRIATTMSEQPTKDMIDFFEKRTQEHIDRVHKNIEKIKGKYPELNYHYDHDASKWSEERLPYIWLTEYYRSGKKLEYPKGMKEKIDRAVLHHYNNNSHHTEFHGKPSSMSHKDLLEMAADWGAMSQEKKSSLRAWADKFIKGKDFTQDQIDFIYKMIDATGIA